MVGYLSKQPIFVVAVAKMAGLVIIGGAVVG